MNDAVICSLPADQQAWATLVLAHGAGAGMDSPFMTTLAEALADGGLRVIRFEFPYMRQRREDGRKRPPNPLPALLEAYREQCRPLDGPLFIGGKSMGGRVASMLADELAVSGLLCFGYPFHPPGRPEKTRIAHLQQLRTPALILQGTRDPFGKPDELEDYGLAHGIDVHWLASGDHDFKPLRASGRSQRQLIGEAVAASLGFCRSQLQRQP